MGLGGIGIGSVILILVIVVVLFGTRKLRSAGTDLGDGIKNFRKSMNDDPDSADTTTEVTRKELAGIEGKPIDTGANEEKESS